MDLSAGCYSYNCRLADHCSSPGASAAAGDDAKGSSSEMQLGERQMIETENPVAKAEPEDELPRTAEL